MRQSFFKRLLSVILCVSILLGASFSRPQKAEAVALTASVVASVAAIMTACGVSYWAATQTDAIDYLGGKIDDYLNSLETVPQSYEDWLGIDAVPQLFEVTANGTMRFASGVANKILGFVRSFNSSEGVVSGGEPVLGQSYPDGWSVVISDESDPFSGSWTATIPSANQIQVNMTDFAKAGRGYAYLVITVPSSGSPGVILSASSGTNPSTCRLSGVSYQLSTDAAWSRYFYPAITDGAFTITLAVGNVDGNDPVTASYVFTIRGADSDLISDTIARVTPSSAVDVAEDVADDDYFDVAPSVPLTQGMTVEQVSEAVLDGAASEDGLTSEGETSAAAAPGWGWLADILSSISDIIAGIAQTVLGIPQAISQGAQDVITGIQSLPQLISDALVNLFVPDEAYIGEFVASLHGIFDNRFSILSYPFSILGEFITRASGIDEDEPILRWPDIYEPFSGQLLIGAGSYNLNRIRQGNFAQAHGLYMVIVKGYISFEFLGFLYSWFCSVFKMREDDFSSPLEDYDGGDDY